MGDLSKAQHVSFAVAMVLFGCLSIIGSSLIVHMAKRDTSLVYYRILIIISTADIFISTSNVFHLFLLPSNKTTIPFAVGNDSTCTLMGFIVNAGIIFVSVYNSFLAVNFVLQIRYKWTNERVAKKVEPVVHVLALVLTLAIPVIGLLQDAYAPSYLSGICIIGEYEETCTQVAKVTAAHNSTEFEDVCTPVATEFGRLASMIVFQLALIGSVGIISTFGVYRAVYTTYTANQKYIVSSKKDTTSSVTTAGETSRIDLRSYETNRTIELARQIRLKRVVWQCIMYSLVYGNTFFWPFLQGVISWTTDVQGRLGEPHIYAVVLLTFIFYPAQGFFNFFVFIQPLYQKSKATLQNNSNFNGSSVGMLTILHHAISEKSTPGPESVAAVAEPGDGRARANISESVGDRIPKTNIGSRRSSSNDDNDVNEDRGYRWTDGRQSGGKVNSDIGYWPGKDNKEEKEEERIDKAGPCIITSRATPNQPIDDGDASIDVPVEVCTENDFPSIACQHDASAENSSQSSARRSQHASINFAGSICNTN